MRSFSDRVVLITGAANGIGRGLARALIGYGARVAAVDRDAAGLDGLARELAGRPLATAVADVTDADGLRAAVAQLEAAVGPTDVLVANAGIMRQTMATEFLPELFAAEVQVNLIGVANSMAAVLPGMIARRRGHLVAVCSLASYRGFPPVAGYCASKAGVRALCDAFRVELRPAGVRVTTLCPGAIETRLPDLVEIPDMPPRLTVGDAVERMLAAVARGREFYAFPAAEAWHLRLLRYLPLRVSDWLVGQGFAKWQRSRERAAQPPTSTPPA